MNEIKILQGSTNLVYEGITNLAELKEFAEEKASKYKNIVVTDENVKECETQIKEIIPYRTDIKKFRATVNKNLKVKLDEQLKQIDDITSIFTEVIEPVTSKIEEYKELKRIEKLEKKKEIFRERLEEINKDLESVNKNLFHTQVELLEFKEEWVNKKDKDIEIIIESEVINRNNLIKSFTERVENVKTYCELLKNQYDLKTSISWEFLRDIIYSDNYKEELERMAQMQVEKEVEIIEVHEEIKEVEKEFEEIKKIEKVQEILKNENIKEFKVKIQTVIKAESEEILKNKINEFLLKEFGTDKIKIDIL